MRSLLTALKMFAPYYVDALKFSAFSILSSCFVFFFFFHAYPVLFKKEYPGTSKIFFFLLLRLQKDNVLKAKNHSPCTTAQHTKTKTKRGRTSAEYQLLLFLVLKIYTYYNAEIPVIQSTVVRHTEATSTRLRGIQKSNLFFWVNTLEREREARLCSGTQSCLRRFRSTHTGTLYHGVLSDICAYSWVKKKKNGSACVSAFCFFLIRCAIEHQLAQAATSVSKTVTEGGFEVT